jgi:RNA-directed DNA polymerase
MLEAGEEVGDGIPEVIAGRGTSAKKHGTEAPEFSTLMEQVVERQNMLRAYRRVIRNDGASGIDGMEATELKGYLDVHWQRIKGELLGGRYQPKAVRVVFIPKVSGGERQLGIPTVVDRLIQQALYQVLNPQFDETFSESSYGFRQGRNAHMAVLQARQYQREGKRWVVDIDLAQFFDEVNHDRLMSRIAMTVKDTEVLKLIRNCLKAGVMIGGVNSLREKGTPQGSPLSPLLSNIVLDEFDKELERRGLKFCRYADDCNIYVRSRKAGERIMASLKGYIETRLKLKVNEQKSVVSRPWKRKFLGYTFSQDEDPKIRIAGESIKRLRNKIKALFREGRGRNVSRFIQKKLNPVLRGWIAYFKLDEIRYWLERMDEWIRRRIRAVIWRQMKRPWTRYRQLMKRGIEKLTAFRTAFNGFGAWRNAGGSAMHRAYTKQYFEKVGLMSLLTQWTEYKKNTVT